MKTIITTDPIKIAKIIDWGLDSWAGNCYGIAYHILKNKVVEGKLRYGHFLGTISPGTVFEKTRSLGFAQHAWIELKDETIFDPTRWVFENKDPYIYVKKNKKNKKDYDIGGNRFRSGLHRQPPEHIKEKEKYSVDELSLEAYVLICSLLTLNAISEKRTKLTIDEIFWIANTTPQILDRHAKEIYNWLEKNNEGSLIPIDNWKWIME